MQLIKHLIGALDDPQASNHKPLFVFGEASSIIISSTALHPLRSISSIPNTTDHPVPPFLAE